MADKVLFLDVDGVLVIAPTFRRMSPELVAQLARILRETGAKVVVSSTWRFEVGFDGATRVSSQFGGELAACGDDGALVRSRIIGKTGDLWNEADGQNVRGFEIQRWLDDHRHSGPFVILDDDSDMGSLTSRLVKTSMEHGLTKEKADEAIRMLGEEVSRG